MKKVFGMVLAVSILSNLFAYELTIKATPSVLFPFLSSGDNRYDPFGYGGFIEGGITLFDFLNVGPEVGFFSIPKNNTKVVASEVTVKDSTEKADGSVLAIPIGVQASSYFYPFSRIELGVGLGLGSAIATTNGRPHYAPWYRAFGECNFRINPIVSVGANVSWFDVQHNSYWGNPGIAGLTTGIAVRFKIDTQKVSGKVEGSLEQEESVFPLLYTIYKDNPIGVITIENNETAEIRNVKVSFRSENYTAADKECGVIKQIRKHKKADIYLYADFSEAILQFAESGKISGEVVIEYELLGKKQTSVSSVTIPVYNRNQIRWMDTSVISSYVSTNSQEVLEFAKYLVGLARGHLRSGLNRNMQFAMYLNEGIRLSGIKCERDEDTPYSLYHINPAAVDYIQYPYQTLTYKSGDRDDIGILFMAMLESVGIPSAFIPLEDDFIVAFNMGVTADKADNFFDGYDRIIVVDDEIWIPLSMSSINEGFINSWYKAIVEVQTLIDNEDDFDFVLLSDAWQSYPPAGFSAAENSASMPAEKTITSTVETDISRYITAEFGPQIAGVQNRIKAEGGSIQLYNQLGMLYVRAGMYSSAIPVYELAAKLGSIPAMNNLGNICTLQKKYKEAQKWYKKVLEIDPENATAIKNLARIESDLEE